MTSDQMHPVALLLPAWLNGTLSPRERDEVETHLAGCAACQRELEEYSSLREALAEVYAGEAGASPKAYRRVMAEVYGGGGVKRIDAWLRSLLGAPWVPTFAAALVVVQLGALSWMLSQRAEPQVESRSVAAPATRLRIAFRETATDRQIQSVLKDIGGRIVDGPSAEGVYVVEITGAPDGSATHARGVLLRRTDVLRSVE